MAKLVLKKEQAKLFEQQVTQYKSDIDNLNTLISLKNEQITQYKKGDSVNQKIVRTYENELQIMKDQVNLDKAMIKSNDKLIKRYKRRVFFRTVGGLAAVGVMTYLYLTK